MWTAAPGIPWASTTGRSTCREWTANDFWAGWLQQRYYDPELVEQDLQRMTAIGINLVSVQSPDPQFYRNLLDFVCRCRKHDVYVNLFCGLASPLGVSRKRTEGLHRDSPPGGQLHHHGVRHDLGTGQLRVSGRSSRRLGRAVERLGDRAVREHCRGGNRNGECLVVETHKVA